MSAVAAGAAPVTAAEIARRVARGETSAEAVTREHLDTIARRDRGLDAFLTVTAERALARARAVDASRAAGGTLGPLAGVPIAIKDVLAVEGVPTTCGSRILEGYRPPFTRGAHVEVPDFRAALGGDLGSLRVGVPWSFLDHGVDAGVTAAFRQAVSDLEGLGARVVEVALPHAPHAIATYYIVATAEASSNLARFDGVRYGLRVPAADLRRMYGETRDRGFGPEVKRRIILGTFVLSAGYYDSYYLRAQQVRTLIRRDFEQAFHACDVVAMPTTPTPAFRL